jgi:hypothetical protein
VYSTRIRVKRPTFPGYSWLFSGRIPWVSGGGTCRDRVIDQGTGLGDSVGASMGLPVVPVWSLAGIDPD